MSSDEESLRALEALLNEFFDARTTNEQKRRIEDLLNNFSHQQGAWRTCFYFLANSANHFVLMYSLTVLEGLINKQWIGLPADEKMEIRAILYKLLLSSHKDLPVYIRNKLVKLVVDIGRVDWPHFYPDFFTNILHLTQQLETTQLGLIFLLTTSEELACPREDLSVVRKEELHRLLLEQVPNVLVVLSGILELVIDKHQHAATATPPPSPTHGQNDSPRSLFSTSPLHAGSLLSSMFKSLNNKKSGYLTLPALDGESRVVCTSALNCLIHFFSWIPLSSYITPSLLNTIFHFASLGCDPILSSLPPHHPLDNGDSSNDDSNSCADSLPKSDGPSLGVLAMECINEILSKNCVPADFEEFLLQMFRNTFHLLQRLVRDCSQGSPSTTCTNNCLADLEENYLQKFTEFLRLFVSVHLRRFESNGQFPVLEFLALLFKYTFQQPNHEGYFSCLEIWAVLLDYLSSQLNVRPTTNGSVIEKYKDALVALVTEIQRKYLFRFNQANLEELDDDSLNDDSETEWQHFLRQCLEIVAKVAELFPEDTFRIIYSQFQENLQVYLGLENCVGHSSQGRQLNVTAENECRRLHCMLRDLSSLLQCLGTLAEQFTGLRFMERFTTAKGVVESLVHTVTYSTRMRLYDVGTVIPTVVKPDFIEVHAQTFASLKAFAHWVAQYSNESHRHGQNKDEVTHLTTMIISAVLPVINKESPEKISHSAAHLLLSLTGTVKPMSILQIPEVQHI